ncbi:hypothetical protein Goarm_019354, partial [Gossypium armourianum]|nr:hypothetical protein [Gossypium armourianum]
VRIRIRKLCKALEEDAFRPVLHHYDGPKFRLELSIPEQGLCNSAACFSKIFNGAQAMAVSPVARLDKRNSIQLAVPANTDNSFDLMYADDQRAADMRNVRILCNSSAFTESGTEAA